HENEIAQSESYSGKRFANYWMHNGLITMNGQKMAKSLGNYLSVSDFLDKYKDPDILKIFFLSSHYRSPGDFTESSIIEAKMNKEKFNIFFKTIKEFISKSPKSLFKSRRKQFRFEKRELLEAKEKEFIKGMDDDFNTAYALGALFNIVNEGHWQIKEQKQWSPQEKVEFLKELVRLIKELGGILGLSFSQQAVSKELKKKIERKIGEREKARRNKDYQLADSIRKELLGQGVAIEDTEDGTKWRLK
ncbi:cysteine--tRNA ligase, partial [bacterium]|nr:cysteine--tRNA ligase [bacterium]